MFWAEHGSDVAVPVHLVAAGPEPSGGCEPRAGMFHFRFWYGGVARDGDAFNHLPEDRGR